MDCLCLAPASLLIFVHARPPISLDAPLAVAVMLVFCGAAALACARRMLHKPGGDPGGAYARVKARFEAHPGCAALLVPSDNVLLQPFFTSANLSMVDAIVSVGTIQPTLLMQVVSAVFHPSAARDVARGVVLLKVEGK